MYNSQDPLLTQLADRCRSFSAGTGLSLNRIAKLIRVDTSNFSAFVNGRTGLSATATIRLLELLNSSKRQLEAKLAAKPIEIRHLQENGEPMRLNAGGAWVSGQSGSDPVDSSDIVGTPTARDLPNARDYEQRTIDCLRAQQELYRSAIAAIEDYLSNAQRATVNRGTGSTEPPRRINENAASRTAGPRPSRFVFDERAHAIKCEENRCAEVDAYYAREGKQRTPEAILAWRVHRDENEKFKPNRKRAYN